jgi:hydroxyacylglutathione hydrolase
VWPAHGAGSACGKGLGAIPSTTVGYEKLFNPAMAYDTEEAFVEYLLSDQPEPPRYFAVMKRVNKEGPAVLRDLPKLELMPAKKLPTLLEAGEQVIDTRNAGSFAGRHIAGTVNIPFDMLAGWAGWIVDYERPLYLIVDPQHAQEAARDLAYIGIDKVVGYFEHEAVATLSESGVPPQAYQVMTPDKIAQRVLNGEYVLIDVRNETEWDEGHIPGAKHMYLGYLQENAAQIVNGKTIVVHCLTGVRSAIGSSILQASGAKEVINMQGGLRDWIAADLPIEN